MDLPMETWPSAFPLQKLKCCNVLKPQNTCSKTWRKQSGNSWYSSPGPKPISYNYLFQNVWYNSTSWMVLTPEFSCSSALPAKVGMDWEYRWWTECPTHLKGFSSFSEQIQWNLIPCNQTRWCFECSRTVSRSVWVWTILSSQSTSQTAVMSNGF